MNGRIVTPIDFGLKPTWERITSKFGEGGKKVRIQNRFVKLIFIGICVLVSTAHIYFGADVISQSESSHLVSIPQVGAGDAAVPPPGTMNDAKAAKLNQQKRRQDKGNRFVSAPRVDRIQAISLSDTSREIPAGSEVPAILKSGGANGMVKVETTEPLTVDGDQILPSKSVLMGQGASNDDRLFIVFRRAVTPDLQQIKIHALAYDDSDRMLGLKGKKISNYAFQLAVGSGLLFLGGMADGMRSDNSSNAFERRRTTARDAALNGVTVATGDLSRDSIEAMKNQQARVEVAHSTPILIIFGDMDAKESQ